MLESIPEIGMLNLIKKRKFIVKPPPMPSPPKTLHPDDLIGYPIEEANALTVPFLCLKANPLETSRCIIQRLENARTFFNELATQNAGKFFFGLDCLIQTQFSTRVLLFAMVAFSWNDTSLSYYSPQAVALRYDAIIRSKVDNEYQKDIADTADFLLNHFFPFLGIY